MDVINVIEDVSYLLESNEVVTYLGYIFSEETGLSGIVKTSFSKRSSQMVSLDLFKEECRPVALQRLSEWLVENASGIYPSFTLQIAT